MAKKKEAVEAQVEQENVLVVEPAKKLKILIAFTDKYCGVDYKVGDVIEFNGERAEELLSDDRHLVMEI